MEKLDPVSDQKKIILWRGICGRCPKCGVGKIFKSYLVQNDKCAACGEDLSRFRADDGPAWMAILLTGFIDLPIALYLAMHETVPGWVALTLLSILTVVAALLILPRAKGFFIAALWLLARKKQSADNDLLFKR